MAERVDILEVVDFLQLPVFQGVASYICLLLFRKRSVNTTSPQVTIARLHHLSEAPASQLARISVASDVVSGGLESFRASQPTGSAQWSFRNKKESDIAELIEKSSDDVLEDIVDIRQGIKTGADSIFALEGSRVNDRYFVIRNTADKIEADLLMPVFRNRDLKRWSARPAAFLLYPYDRQTLKPLTWATFERKFPATVAYLSKNKKHLAKRKSVKGKAWYELIRPRLSLLKSALPRMFVAELTLRPTVCQTATRNALILGGAGGGSILDLKNAQYDAMALMAYINSVPAEWYFRQISSVFRGGYISLEQKNLARLPLPRFLKDPESFARNRLTQIGAQIARRLQDQPNSQILLLRQEIEPMEAEINSLIFEGLKVTASQGEYIRQAVKIGREEIYS